MLTRMGGEGSDSVPAGRTGTGAQAFSRVRISRPAWPARRKSRVMEP